MKRSLALGRLRRYEEALEDASEALGIRDHLKEVPLLRAATALAGLGRLVAAKAACEEALSDTTCAPCGPESDVRVDDKLLRVRGAIRSLHSKVSAELIRRRMDMASLTDSKGEDQESPPPPSSLLTLKRQLSDEGRHLLIVANGGGRKERPQSMASGGGGQDENQYSSVGVNPTRLFCDLVISSENKVTHLIAHP